MSKPVVISTNEWDPLAAKFMPPKLNASVVMKNVYVISTQTNRSLHISTPMMMTWGISDYDDGSGGDGRFTMTLNFPKDDYVDVYVEGRNINSCSWKNNNNYIKLSGTSMSTPKVSGFLARMLEKYDGDVDKSLLNLYKNLDENKMLVIN